MLLLPVLHLDSLASSTTNSINSSRRAVIIDSRLNQDIQGSTVGLLC